MKIGFFLGDHHKYRQGGAEIQVKLIIEGLIKQDHDVFYVCYGDQNHTDPDIIEDGVRLYKIKKPWRGYKFLLRFNSKAINEIVKKEKPDIIYQRGDFHFWDLLTRYPKEDGIKVVSSLSMERHCIKVRPRSNQYYLLDMLNERMKIRYYKNSSLIISQTFHQRDMLKQNFDRSSIVIHNGHPIPKGPFNKKDPIQVIWVANLKPIKQPEIFIELARSLEKENIKFLMIGRPGSGEYQKRIDELIREVSNLEYIGELDLEKTNQHISTSSLLVNTSISEGFSNTFIQAWLRETPVISLNTDPDDLLSKYGIGRRSGDVDKLVNDVQFYIDNVDKLNKMGKKARKIAIKRFNIEDKITEHINAFRDILEK